MCAGHTYMHYYNYSCSCWSRHCWHEAGLLAMVLVRCPSKIMSCNLFSVCLLVAVDVSMGFQAPA